MSSQQSIWFRIIKLLFTDTKDLFSEKSKKLEQENTIKVKELTRKSAKEKINVSFPLDLYQTANSFIIQALVATNPDNVTIEVDKNGITINVKRSNDNFSYPASHHCHECLWGNFSRTINLPIERLNRNNIEAEVHHGLLTVILPKIQEYQGKFILLGGFHSEKKINNIF